MARKPNPDAALRYPLTEAIGPETDYLVIRVSEYKPPTLKSDTNTPFLFTRTTKRIEEANRNGTIRRLETIQLPVPENVADGNSVKWNDDQLDPLGAAAFGVAQDFVTSANVGKGIGGLTQALADSGGKLKAAYDALDENTRGSIRDALIAGGVNQFNANIDPDKLVSRTQGQVLNPNLELLFQGVNLKTYDFNFTFTPRSQPEAQRVRRIIKVLKRRMAAKTTVTGGNSQARGIFIKAPDIFDMEFRKGGQKHPYLFTMQPCALRSMSVNYVGAGPYITYDDGSPIKIQMRLRFTELSPVYSEDYDNLDENDLDGVGF